MTNNDKAIRSLIEAETNASEAGRDAPLPAGAKLTRPNRGRGTVFSVRLTSEELDQLSAKAREKGIPASTLARSLILLGLRAGFADGVKGTVLDPSLRAAIHDEVYSAVSEALGSP